MASSISRADRPQGPESRSLVDPRAAELELLNAELRARNRQQTALASLSQLAIRERDLASLLHQAAAATAETLGTEFSAIGELVEKDSILLRAGAGWTQGMLGRKTRLADTPAAYMLEAGEPVVIADTATETRFRISPPMAAHGVQSAIYVTIRGRARMWGTLAAYATRARAFTGDDVRLLQSIANILALAFERHDLELAQMRERKRAVAERDQLIREATASQKRLGAVSRRLLTAQEEERRHLAVELHDELGQVLTAVKINLETLERSLPPGALPALAVAIESVDHAMHRARDIAFDLRPAVLDDLGLPPALRWYVDRLARLGGIEAHVAIDAIPDIDPNTATACFRVAQEALTNVARHGHARNVWLELHLVTDGLELQVRDDGAGFDVPSARKNAMRGESMGLLGMEERVSLVGGTFEIRAAVGQGSLIRARFPLEATVRKRP